MSSETSLRASSPPPDGMELGTAVSVSSEIGNSAEAVWALISAPGYLALCHPFCGSNDVQKWPGIGARDRITYLSGLEYHREFTHWIEGSGYRLEIGPEGTSTARVIWEIEPLKASQCQLTITVIPYIRSDLTASRKRAYERMAFARSIDNYLQSVSRGVEHYVTTGERVKPNQFGCHPIYSANLKSE